jgi:hypothetical protein
MAAIITGLTKLDVAEREIVAAVRLLFDGGDCVPVYVLAAAAREITTTLCEKRGIRSMFDGLDDAFPEKTRNEMYKWVHIHAAFFKHARTDPNGVLEGFEEDEAQAVLYIACEDFCRLCGGGPFEIQAFSLWYAAMRGLIEPMPGPFVDQLRSIATKPRAVQLDMAKQLLAWIRAEPTLRRTYSTK